MSTNPCPLAWILAVEALASFQEVAVSFLIDIVKRAPKEINDPIGDNAREMVSFRILDKLWAQMKPPTAAAAATTVSTTTSVSDCGVGFDLSQTCEDALQEILAESSESMKWDLERFIEHKRYCLPKCALDKLKDAILEDHPLIPVYLKEMSGLVIKNKSDDSAKRLEGNDSDVGGNLPARVSLSAKRVREVSATVDSEGPSTSIQVIMDNAHAVSSNADDKDNSCTQQTMEVQKLVSFHGSRLIEQDNESGSALAKEAMVGSLKESNVVENFNYEHCAAKRRRRINSDGDGADLLHNQQHASRNYEEQLSPATSVDGQDKEVGGDEAKEDGEHCAKPETANGTQQAHHTRKTNSVDEVADNSEHSFLVNPPNDACSSEAKVAMGHSCEPDIFIEDDSYCDGNINRTVSSQCTHNEFASATEDRTEQQNCIICKKDGQLLVCNSDACPRVVHESCLGVAATFDESGCFYCPVCEYSRAISDFMKSKNKFSLARKYLASFTSLGDGSVVGNSPNGVRDQNQIRENEELNVFIEPGRAENVVDKVTSIQSRVNTKDMQQVEPSISSDSPCGVKRRVSNEDNNVDKSIGKAGNCETDDSMCREREQLTESEEQREVLPKTHAVTRVENQVCSADTHEAQVVVKKPCLRSLREKKEQAIAPLASQACDTHNSKCSNSKTVHGDENHGAIKKDQEVLNQQQKVLCQKTVSSRRTDGSESLGEKNDKSNASNHKLRAQKQEFQYTYPAVHLLRRKAIQWTDDEEEILKEGVRKFASNNSTKMPWKTILEFGKGTFHEGRTTIDLKDKWRNICKGRPVV